LTSALCAAGLHERSGPHQSLRGRHGIVAPVIVAPAEDPSGTRRRSGGHHQMLGAPEKEEEEDHIHHGLRVPAAAPGAGGPEAPSRLPSSETTPCANTLGTSPAVVADSRGRVCDLERLGGDGCCCDADEPPACARCGPTCCATYEHCVACCVGAENAAARGDIRRRATHAALRDAPTEWDLCRFRCLTNSGSVLHQNSYRSAEGTFCYATSRPPLEADMSVNAVDAADYKDDALDGDPTDPYVAGPGAMTFPCDAEGCVVPEQDRAKLANAVHQDRATSGAGRRHESGARHHHDGAAASTKEQQQHAAAAPKQQGRLQRSQRPRATLSRSSTSSSSRGGSAAPASSSLVSFGSIFSFTKERWSRSRWR